ncbi:MAG TPA: response regulator [Longimicrobiales bacterium]|nr:response regulator [Longimicrobiales bacterium]
MARILIVEDDPAQREIYTQLLYYNGFEVITAEDGEHGVRLAFEQRPDAIVMDIMLPVMSGLTAAALIRANPLTANTPIIFMSAYSMLQEHVSGSGGREFLLKPVRGDRLVLAIRRHIGWDEIEPIAQ